MGDMSTETLLAAALQLTQAERVLLVEDIWDSIAAEGEDLQLTEEMKAELDLRLEAYHKNPSAGSSWEEVRDRLLRKS